MYIKNAYKNSEHYLRIISDDLLKLIKYYSN